MFLDYDDINDPLAGITMPSALEEWFTKAGYTKIFDNISFKWHSNRDDIAKLNEYQRQGYTVVSLINDELIQKYENFLPFLLKKVLPIKKSHWIVWNDEVREKESGKPITSKTLDNTIVKLELFSWGRKMQITQKTTLDKFLWRTFGALIFSKENLL